ncbi:MAG TPA: hypothetical protein VL400_04240, partial [Polyangiaceae bacterium]|nr:hypothetical protein [Polyangiaceae bacterium]
MAKSAGAGWGLATLMGCGTLVGAPPADNPAHASRIESAEEPPEGRAEPPSIVLVAIDGARWQDVFLGTDRRLLDEAGLDAKDHAATADVLTPHLAELARQGVALGAPGQGAPFLASGPNFVSMPGYSELLTGHPASCQENDCEPPAHTVFDAFAPRDAAFFASWHRLGAFESRVPDSVVMSAGRLSPPPRDWIA